MLTTLRRIVQEVNREPELNTALEKMVCMTRQAMATECCSVFLADNSQQHFMLMATDGLSPDAVGRLTVGFAEGVIGWVGQREEPINLADASSHERFKADPEAHEEQYRAFLGVPIIHHKKVLGVITLQQSEARVFSEDEEAFLVTLSAQIASVLAHVETKKHHFSAPKQSTHQAIHLKAVAGAAGVAMGQAVIYSPLVDFDSISLSKIDNIDEEIECFYKAVELTRNDFEEMSRKLSEHLPSDALNIFEIYQQMLDSASIGKEVIAHIKMGWCAMSALKIVVNKFIDQFSSMEDDYIRQRATDVWDLGCQVLKNLQKKHHHTEEHLKVAEDVILIANEVTASMLADIPRKNLKAIVSVKGSTNSHAAIMARGMGIPAVLGVEELPLMDIEGKTLAVDGYNGFVLVSPPDAVIGEYQKLLDEEAMMQTQLLEEVHLPSNTLDNVAFSLLLNSGLGLEAEHGLHLHAAGIGLYRTELPFMLKEYFPSETEQATLYRRALELYPNDPVTIRTLDIGGDKSLPYFPIVEDNPFLGWRGIRVTLDHPEIFLVQIRALIKANIGKGNLKLMLPMVADVGEVDEALRFIKQAYFEVNEEYKAQHNVKDINKPSIGVMLEVPAAVFQLQELAQRVDFFSVGSNDLTQYLLAVDRNNARVASLYDSFHPAVLRVLAKIANQSANLHTPVSVCGELAGEPRGAILLLAMGYRDLSMNPQNLLKVKYVLRHISVSTMTDILDQCLNASSAHNVKAIMDKVLRAHKMSHLIHAGG
ncbi:phosphoenolpyruvate--protein phosphotransferase [Flocculibacter collagenilyticus]|uniref:phosphoenolpyruvate--protein phosphotransferase n=1 Tax=Flocculibacter collagenilyticus TaxID=2744479 RepID=UPI0018F687CA|nr:phosphoenolpyruvate--protein phosphotransferase [Flocculibacter collagenilyticus]